ncbi:MAG: hypothetical protein OXF09_06150 [Hyphomicrobiales bacterium]|nr:hypothetical protein [Hyphomicrobiales bacterium]
MNLFANLPTNFPMSLSIEILLSGFLGYWVASGGNRAKYGALYVIIGVLLFAVIGVAAQQIVGRISYPSSKAQTFFILITPVATAVGCGVLWRWKVGEWIFLLLRWGGITTQTFGPSNAWEDFAFNAGWKWFFIRVTLLDGTVLECNQVKNSKDGIPELSTDEEGNLLFVATGKWDKNKPNSESLEPTDENGRLIFTYIPASQIVRTDVHTEKESKKLIDTAST